MKKGFTLIELLAVIVILGLLGMIVTSTVSKSLKSAKEELYNTQINLIISGAEAWASKNVLLLPDNNEYITITLGQIKEAGLIDDVINPKTKTSFSDSMKIKITRIGNNYKYEIEGEE